MQGAFIFYSAIKEFTDDHRLLSLSRKTTLILRGPILQHNLHFFPRFCCLFDCLDDYHVFQTFFTAR